MTDATTGWTVSVSKDTDTSVRSFLAQRGMKKGDLSKFIEEAVKWRTLELTIAEARSKFADLPPEEQDTLIAEHTGLSDRDSLRAFDLVKNPPRANARLRVAALAMPLAS